MTIGVTKRPTLVAGLDEMTFGGLPDRGATLVAGSTGSGKTVLALEIAARAARLGRPTAFVSFEEAPDRLRAAAASFDWGATIADDERIQLIDARPDPNHGVAGPFDLEGLLALLGELTRSDGAWIVLDGVDQLLSRHPEPGRAVAELRRLDAWSAEHGVPVLLTGKVGAHAELDEQMLGSIEFMLPVAIRLSTTMVGQRLGRRLRIVKYRGSEHVKDEVPMVLDGAGVHLPYGAELEHLDSGASHERIGTGVPRLDGVLGGGLFRGSTVLLSGAPGTAKTTLATSVAAAAARRGERSLIVTFDETSSAIVRNLASIGLDLAPHLTSGRLTIVARPAWKGLPEEHFLAIHRQVEELRPDVLVVDPISALMKASDDAVAHLSVERILAAARARGVTTVLTSLLDGNLGDVESTVSRASTLADTWIALEYRVTRGERNRGLSVVKSRGSGHSNQLRELRLSSEGIELIDVYPHGGDVLMGTARLYEEQQLAERNRRLEADRAARRSELTSRLEEARRQARDLEEELSREEAEHARADARGDIDRRDIVSRRRSTAENDDEAGS